MYFYLCKARFRSKLLNSTDHSGKGSSCQYVLLSGSSSFLQLLTILVDQMKSPLERPLIWCFGILLFGKTLVLILVYLNKPSWIWCVTTNVFSCLCQLMLTFSLTCFALEISLLVLFVSIYVCFGMTILLMN